MQPLPIITTMGCRHGAVEKENNPFGVEAPQETSSQLLDTIFADDAREFTMENDSRRMDRLLQQDSMQRQNRNHDEMSSSTPRRGSSSMGLRRHGSMDHPSAPSRSRKTFPRTTEPWGDLASTSSIPPPPGFETTNETQSISDEIIDTAMKLMDLTIQQDRYIRNLVKEFN